MALAPLARAQSDATATQGLRLSAFAGGTGTDVGLAGGKNAGITAGADLSFLNLLRGYTPSLEIRGTYPVDDGHIMGEKNFLGGVKIEHRIRRYHFYGDFLVGRGENDYGSAIPPIPVNNTTSVQYVSTNTFVYSPGGGLDYDITHHIDFKADVQFQHWNVPLKYSNDVWSIADSSAWATAVTLGVLYNFDFNPHHTWR